MSTPDDTRLEKGSTKEHCSRWPDEVNGEGHAFESHKPANSPLWIRRCSFCGWIDGDEIAAALRDSGWVDPEEAAKWRETVVAGAQAIADIDARGGNYSGVLFREAANALDEKLAKEGSDGAR